MVETEYKFAVPSATDTIAVLEKAGYACVKERTHELSVMYDNPQGVMQHTDGRIRVRQSGETVEFCYKKPMTREGVKQEIEHEVRVDALEPLQQILSAMEFTPTTSYERYRTEYRRNGVKATVDQYPFATFLELEGDLDAIKQASAELGFSESQNLTDSCDTLFIRWRAERQLPYVPHMTFDGYDIADKQKAAG